MYRISSQFNNFYKLEPNNQLKDYRWLELKKWLKQTHKQHSTDWLLGEQINYELIIEFDEYLKNQEKSLS